MGVNKLRAALAVMALLVPYFAAILPVGAASGDRTLYLYYTHTKETARITFRRGGKYDQKGLKELNRFLRDWRRNEPTKMDPALFDLVWEVYQEVGATGPIYVVSAYRSPATNEMLRAKSSGVAKNSRHTKGMAMDFYIPGVPLSKLRAVAMKKQVGGVGYYPTSGSPFVHLDTGNVRAWPRMTRSQLKKIFPDGKTLHLPADGKVLSQQGYNYAKAQWVQCHTVPCSGRSTTTVRVASTGGSEPSLLDRLFGQEESEGAEESISVTRVAAAPATAPVPAMPSAAIRPVAAPLPAEPVLVATADTATPAPLPRPPRLQPDTQSNAAVDAITVASTASAPVPIPRATAPVYDQEAMQTLLTAYAPATEAQPDAQRVQQVLIDGASVSGAPAATDGLRLASIPATGDLNAFAALFEGLAKPATPKPATPEPPAMPVPLLALEIHDAQLQAPDLDHIIEIFVDPKQMATDRYAVLFDTPDPDLAPQTALGAMAPVLTFTRQQDNSLPADRFNAGPILLLAAR